MTQFIEQLVQEIGDTLKSRHVKLVTAESCTGGGLAYALTQLPGSSDWFERGYVTYSNHSKEELLSVNPLTLAAFGAVSEQVAHEMAEGALHRSQAQMSIAITGIAGPLGGSKEKPVGTIWIGYAGISIPTQTDKQIFSGTREQVREQTVKFALEFLLFRLKGM